MSLALLVLAALSSPPARALSPSKPCPGYAFETREITFDRYRPPETMIAGVRFPRDEGETYRGAEWSSPQFDRVTALRAMLGDPFAYVGSKLFAKIRQALAGSPILDKRAFRADFWAHHILDDVARVQACAPFSDSDATLYAVDLTRKAFFRQVDALGGVDFLLDQTIPSFDWWPDIAVYSSVYPEIAAWYGGKGLSYRASRSIDRPYWLQARGTADIASIQGDHPQDAGSLLTPGYIRPEDVTGFYWRNQETRFSWQWNSVIDMQYPNWGTSVVFRKIEDGGRRYAAVLDAMNEKCVDRGPDGRFYVCGFGPGKPSAKAVRPAPVPDLKREVPLIGILAACDPAAPCVLPAKLRKLFRVPSRSGPGADLLNVFKAVRVPGKDVRFFSPDGRPVDLSAANDCAPGRVWRLPSDGDRACVTSAAAEKDFADRMRK